jgi:hypothetical protein
MPEINGNTIVNEEELKISASCLNCSTSDILAQAPVRLYKGKNDKWEYSGVYGILNVTADMKRGIVFLSLVSLVDNSKAFEQECYENFSYVELNQYFHYFEGDEEIIGICYADDFDAARFKLKLTGLITVCSKITVKKEVKQVERKDSIVSKNTSTKDEGFNLGSFVGGLFTKKNKKEEKTRPTKLNISEPKNFVHVSHMGWTKEGFNEENIPEDWKGIFKKAGVKDEDLKDKKTAKFIMVSFFKINQRKQL